MARTSSEVLCTTTKGDLALILRHAKIGDDIFIARGVMLPFVLRSRSVMNPIRPRADNQSAVLRIRRRRLRPWCYGRTALGGDGVEGGWGYNRLLGIIGTRHSVVLLPDPSMVHAFGTLLWFRSMSFLGLFELVIH